MAAQNLFQQTSRWNDSITRLQRESMFWVNIRLIGIELVASLFEADDVPVSLIAGVATAEPVRQMLLEKLKTSESMKKLIYHEPQLPPVLGAVDYGIMEFGMTPERDVLEKWKRGFQEL